MKGKRIGVILQGSTNWYGGIEYSKNLILSLCSLPHDVRNSFELFLIMHDVFDENVLNEIAPFANGIYKYNHEIKFDSRLIKNIFNRIKGVFDFNRIIADLRIRSIIKKEKIDFVYPFYPTFISNLKNYASWIWDFQHKYLPQYFSIREIHGREKSFKRVAQKSPAIVFSSNNALSDFNKFFPGYNHKTKVLHFRTVLDEKWFNIDPVNIQLMYNLPDEFFIVCNQFWKHKNHLIILEALRKLRDKKVFPNIVFTGKLYDHRMDDHINAFFSKINYYGLNSQIFVLGHIPKDHQIQLMRRSIAVIQPSLFEGWSTVVENARALGKAVILSNIPVHVEQNPPDSVFFKSDSAESLAECIDTLNSALSPGPNRQNEVTAKNRNQKEVKYFAYDFLDICGL